MSWVLEFRRTISEETSPQFALEQLQQLRALDIAVALRNGRLGRAMSDAFTEKRRLSDIFGDAPRRPFGRRREASANYGLKSGFQIGLQISLSAWRVAAR
jgi:hypothetical protein